MPVAEASQWVEVTTPKVPRISGRVVNGHGRPPQLADLERRGQGAQRRDHGKGGDLAGARVVLARHVLDRHLEARASRPRPRCDGCCARRSGRPRSRAACGPAPMPARLSAAATLTLAGKPRAPSRALPSNTLRGSLEPVERDAVLLEIGRAGEAARRLAGHHGDASDLALGGGAHRIEPEQRAGRHDDPGTGARAPARSGRRARAAGRRLPARKCGRPRSRARRPRGTPRPARTRPRRRRGAASSASGSTGTGRASAMRALGPSGSRALTADQPQARHALVQPRAPARRRSRRSRRSRREARMVLARGS